MLAVGTSSIAIVVSYSNARSTALGDRCRFPLHLPHSWPGCTHPLSVVNFLNPIFIPAKRLLARIVLIGRSEREKWFRQLTAGRR